MISRGWIRVRHHKKAPEYWRVQYRDIETARGIISSFIQEMIKQGKMRPRDKIKVTGDNAAEIKQAGSFT